MNAPSSSAVIPPLDSGGSAERSLPVVEISAHKKWYDFDFALLWAYRELLSTLILRDIQVLYKQAALGAAWAILQPLFAVLIFSIVFGHFAKMPSDGMPYPIFAFAALVPWTYFAEAMRRAGLGLVNDSELVRKIYFPRLILPLAGVLAPLLDCFIYCLVFLAMLLLSGIEPSWRLLTMPLFLGLAGLLALSVGLWLGPINVRFRDVKHTLPFLIQVWMYASPIIYPLSLIPSEWRWAYSLNPMVGVIEGFRWAAFGQADPDWTALGIGMLLIAALLLGGLIFFKRMERSFADVI